jgi:hypothetical protein
VLAGASGMNWQRRRDERVSILRFAAIDHPLTRAEMAQLRAVSTRAEITSAGFINHYEWGDLKANPSDWMRRYFDAFVYTANWCSCRFSLRVPLATFRKTALKSFAAGGALTIDASDAHWIIHWSLNESEDYDRFSMDDGNRWMWRLAPLRDELLRGDLRPLYLGWLASADELDDDAKEPDVPPGLANLSPAQQALVEFIEVDPDMLTAAAAASANASSRRNVGLSLDRIGLRLDRRNKFQPARRQRANHFRRVTEGHDSFLRDPLAAVGRLRNATAPFEEIVLVAQTDRDLLHFHSFMAR